MLLIELTLKLMVSFFKYSGDFALVKNLKKIYGIEYNHIDTRTNGE